ncbi:RNA-binding protein [Clostridiaceae bacterium 14S0207]|nr:RNA-binding protein [Clostridiaceae bacterium 14S0207]
MNKKEFLNEFNYGDKEFLGSIYDKYILATKTNKNIFVNEFLNPSIWNKLYKLSISSQVNIAFWSSYEECERKLVMFYTEYLYDEFPVNILRIRNKSNKFVTLNHRDYLGTLMSLGIKREKLGDLVIRENICYVPVLQEVSQYIIYNLDTIGKASCEVEIFSEEDIEFPNPIFKELNILTTSMRLDCVVSALTCESRNASCEMIQKGKVILNYEEEIKKDRLVKENDILSIRGYGKFKIKNQYGSTQKDRLKLKGLKFM